MQTKAAAAGLKRVAQAKLPTKHGAFQVVAYAAHEDDLAHLALVQGNLQEGGPVLCRLHSECLTGEALGSLRCDCGEQLDAALEAITRQGRGLLLYLRQEGRGIGLGAKIAAYALQDQGLDTLEANVRLGYPPDGRDYQIAAEILRDLGVSQVRLMTNNPDKIKALERYGIEVTERVSLEMPARPENRRYLQTKRKKFGHLLELPPDDPSKA